MIDFLYPHRNDLKEVMKRAGVEGKPVLLFLEDHQMVDPAFLEYINSIRTSWSTHGDAADDLYLNAAIEVTGEVWYVTDINHNNDANDVVTTTHATNGQIQGRSVQFCVDNIM